MKTLVASLAAVLFSVACAVAPGVAQTQADPKRIVLVVHGGSGSITRATMPAEFEVQYRASLERALLAGHRVLASGASAVDAVVATIKVLEDDPLFNAGKGAVFSAEGRNELDASLMDGRTGLAGAVAGVTTVKNPITAARAVMEKTRHVLLAGPGADRFAADQKLDIVEPAYFFTQRRWDQLQRARQADRIQPAPDPKPRSEVLPGLPGFVLEYGTVGAVALDQYGNLAAGTSTGGLTNKLAGRVGDSPIIGAGTYADNATVAVSCTGTGEFYMRGLIAYDVAARIRYSAANLSDAVARTMAEALSRKNGTGGLIALNARGEVKFAFNTEGMFRGFVRADGKPEISMFGD